MSLPRTPRLGRAPALVVALGAVTGCELAFPLDPSYVGDAGSSSSGYEQVVLAEKPLVYFRLDDPTSSVKDSSGHAHDGMAGPGIKLGVKGLIQNDADTAMSFPGTGDVGKITVPPSADLQRASNLSVEVWVRFDAGPIPLSQRSFVQYGSDQDTRGASYKLLMDSADMGVQGGFTFQVNVPDSMGTLYTQAISSSSPPTGAQIYHVVGTFDGTHLTVYVNGVPTTTQVGSAVGITYPTMDSLYVGGYAPDVQSTTVFGGVLDEVAIYDHVLSAKTVLEHYRAGAPASP